MSATATLVYKAFLGGASAGTVQGLMSSVPVPPTILSAFGLRVISDATTSADPVVRTIVLGLNPPSAASATATLADQGASGSGVGSITVSAAGSGYVLPPIVSFTGGRPIPPVEPGFPTQTIDVNQQVGSLNSPAVAQAYLKAVGTNIGSGGSGYDSATTTLVVAGRQEKGGAALVLTPTFTGGVLTGVAITAAGSGYTGVPQISVVDSSGSGSGASVTVTMGVSNIDVLRPGTGYDAAPTVVLTPVFQAFFPPSGDQAAPFQQLMTSALEEATMGPVTASPVVIA